MMIDLPKKTYLKWFSLYNHVKEYYFYYLILLLLPFFYNKISFKDSDVVFPIASFKFFSLYIVTFIVLVFICVMAIYIQKLGTRPVDKVREWKKRLYRMLFYSLPIVSGFVVLISVKFISYDGEEIAAVLWKQTGSGFLMYLILMFAFTVWLEIDPYRNLMIRCFSSRLIADFAVVETEKCPMPNSDRTCCWELQKPALEKVSQVVEETITSVMKLQWQNQRDMQVKGIVNETIQEFAKANLVAPAREEQLIDALPLKSILKDAIKEADEEREDLSDVLLENLYATLHVKSITKLIPYFNELKEVMFFHIFAIESHSKHAYVILTDGTRVEADHILDGLKQRGLFNWMAKVNKYYYINMMHVSIDVPLEGKIVRIQALTRTAICQNLDKGAVLKIVALGSGLKNKYIEEFLESRFELSYEGWNAFVRLD